MSEAPPPEAPEPQNAPEEAAEVLRPARESPDLDAPRPAREFVASFVRAESNFRLELFMMVALGISIGVVLVALPYVFLEGILQQAAMIPGALVTLGVGRALVGSVTRERQLWRAHGGRDLVVSAEGLELSSLLLGANDPWRRVALHEEGRIRLPWAQITGVAVGEALLRDGKTLAIRPNRKRNSAPHLYVLLRPDTPRHPKADPFLGLLFERLDGRQAKVLKALRRHVPVEVDPCVVLDNGAELFS